MSYSVMPALIRRELIDNRVEFLWTPAVLLALMLFVVFSLLILLGRHGLVLDADATLSLGEFTISGDHGLYAAMSHLAQMPAPLQKRAVAGVLQALATPALFALPFIVFFTLLAVLYEERRDRTILFWKSMPVSDGAEVAAKFATAALIAPLMTLLLVVLAQVLAWLAFVAAAAAVGASVAPWVNALPTILAHWVRAAVSLEVWALWAAPVWGWALFCSAIAPRSPFAFAVLPPLVLVIIESLFFRTDHFGAWLSRHLLAAPMFDAGGGHVDLVGFPPLADTIGSLGDPGLWVGLAVSAAFLAAATWARRHAI